MRKTAKKFITIALLACLAVRVAGGEFFVAPHGTPQGNGSLQQPWDIVTALADNTKTQNVNNVVKPGDTIWLRGGMYGTGGSWIVCSQLTGTSNQPIVLRQHSGERAVVDGGISAQGAWTTFFGFEVMNSSTNRTGLSTDRQPGLNLLGLGHRCINLIVHDVGHPGIGAWYALGDGAEIYGCVMWGNGIYSYDPGWTNDVRGSAIYTQNESGHRYITDVISFKNFNIGIKAYGQGARTEGFHFDGNVVFENNGDGIFIDSTGFPTTNAILNANIEYNNNISRVGAFGQNNQNLLVSSNYFIHTAEGAYQYSTSFKGWKNLILTNNTFVELSTIAGDAQTAVFWEIVRTNMIDSNMTVLNANANRYYGKGFGSNYDNWRLDQSRKTFGTIQGLGYEATGTFNLTTPAQNVVVLRKNKYERGRANLVVLNWRTNSSEGVDISGIGLQNGERYQVRDVQNYLGVPAVIGTFYSTNPTVNVPLNLTNCSKFIGNQNHYRRDPNLHTDTVFNAYVILPVIPLGAPSNLLAFPGD